VKQNLPSGYNVRELDWWESTQYKDLTITATPAQHFSGRGVLDRFQTLWASFAIIQNGAGGKI